MADGETERYGGGHEEQADDVEVLRSGRNEARIVLDHQ